jgi:hypothetical protein
MSYLTWYESPRFKSPSPTIAPSPDPEDEIELRSIAQIESELRNRPELNAINESQLYHLLDIEIAKAKKKCYTG